MNRSKVWGSINGEEGRLLKKKWKILHQSTQTGNSVPPGFSICSQDMPVSWIETITNEQLFWVSSVCQFGGAVGAIIASPGVKEFAG